MPTPIPSSARIQVELMKLGRTRLAVRIPVQEGFQRGFGLSALSPRNNIHYRIALVDCLQLDGSTLYLKGGTRQQPSLASYNYESQDRRDEAYTMFLQLLTEANRGVDPRVESASAPARGPGEAPTAAAQQQA